MKNSVTLFPLFGSAYAIVDYAETIASCTPTRSNAYVMAIDDNGETLWTIQAGDDPKEAKSIKITPEIARVEIYDHSDEWKYEQVYLRAGQRGQKSLDQYMNNLSEVGVKIDEFENRTKLVANH